MKIRYSNTRFDVFQGKLFLTTYNRGLRLIESVIIVVLGWMLWRGSDSTYSVASRAFTVGLCLLFVVCVVLAARVLLVAVSVFLEKNKGLIGEHSLELKDEGLEERTEYNTSLHKWVSPMKIRTAGNCRLLYVTDNSAHIIPPQCRVLEGDREQFLSAIKARM